MSTAGSSGHRLGSVLKRAQHAFRTTIDTRLRPLGLTAPQHAILAAVALDAGISNAALARVAFVTPQTMQGILSNMLRDGLLTRTPDPRNKRILRTEVTEKGRRTLLESSNVVDEIERRIVEAVGEQNVGPMVEMLTKCADALSIRE